MSEKRRDSKNRILRSGESQRKDGRYAYKYTDVTGKTQFVYSWKLEKTDRMPKGKRDDISLREKEKEIQKIIESGTITNGGGYTVQKLLQKYLNQKTNIKNSTSETYEIRLNFIKSRPFGNIRIDKIKPSDAKQWVITLNEEGMSYNFITSLKTLLRAAFNMAIEDDLLIKNPFNFKINSVIVNDTVKREALSKAQEEAYLSFIKNNIYYQKYYDAIYILFNTGLRISEFCGLTKSDINFTKKRIIVDHQLIYNKTKKIFEIMPPKTKKGNREIPMTDSVYKCFERIIERRRYQTVEPIVDGKSGFLFFKEMGEVGMPKVGKDWGAIFNSIMKAYNRADFEGKVELPKVTPHVCRHTFCTKMVLAGTSPNVLQYLMGHSDIKTTLGVYTNIQYEDIVKLLDDEIAKINDALAS